VCRDDKISLLQWLESVYSSSLSLQICFCLGNGVAINCDCYICILGQCLCSVISYMGSLVMVLMGQAIEMPSA
jgi:hypothetical protein